MGGKSIEGAASRARLLRWYRRKKRDLAWRRTSDPYAIWVSEIMLQQTRVAAVVPYYERFLRRFPDGLPHPWQVRRQLRPLRDDRGIHALRTVAGVLHHHPHVRQEPTAVGAGVGGVVRGVALADIPQAGGPQEGVDDGVEEDIGVAVAAEAGLAGQRQTSQDEGSPLLEAVYIIADAHTHV